MKSQKILHYLLLATILTLPFSGVRFFILGVPICMPELMVIFASAMFVYIKWHTDTFRMQKLPRSIVASITMIVIGLFSSSIFNGLSTVSLGIIKSWFFFPILFAWLLFQSFHLRSSGAKNLPEKMSPLPQYTLLIWYITLSLTSIAALSFFFQNDLTYDGRLRAFYLSPNYLALFLFPGVLLGWHFLIKYWVQRKPWLFAIALASWMMLCATLYLTLSYTVITASLLGFFIALFLASNRSYFSRITLIALFVSSISFFLLFQMHGQKFSDLIHFNERSSLVSRMMIWQSSIKMIADHPIIGIGPGNFQTTYLDYQSYFPPYLEWAVPHPHNLYLAFWLQTGIIGLIGFICLNIFWIHHISSYVTHGTKKVPFAWTLLGILIALLCIGLLDTPYWKNDLAYTFWLLIALGLYKPSLEKDIKA
ncbi:MAG: O-antigen ligase family protein [Candidatus Moranbacteria bacterium]|nr:O-antigen ligase family protein [Candidatus Moranbacteria bacterium]